MEYLCTKGDEISGILNFLIQYLLPRPIFGKIHFGLSLIPGDMSQSSIYVENNIIDFIFYLVLL